MAISTSYRWVSVGKLTVRNNAQAPDGAPSFGLGDLLGAMRAVEQQPEGLRAYQNNERRMWFGPTAAEQNYCFFVVQTGDLTAADPAFVDFGTLATRDAGKHDNEGSHFCSHVLIALNPDPVGRHLILLEKVPGVSFTTLKAHFNWLLNQPRAARTLDVDGEPKTYRGVVEIDSYQSTTLSAAMTSGTVMDMTFVGNQMLDQGVDEQPLVREKSRQVRWEIGRRVDNAGALALLRDGIDFARGWEDVEHDSKQLLVRIKSHDGQIKTAAVAAEAEAVADAAQEALEGAFCLNERIANFDVPLTQRYDNIRDDVVEKLKERAAHVGER